MIPVSFYRVFLIFLRIGNLTFGGGDPTMAALQSELVSTHRWLSPERYGLVYALARITPGTNLLAFCAGTAYELLGWGGAIVAVAAVTVPSAAVVVLLTAGYQTWKSNPLAMAAIGGTLAAAVGMMATSAWQLLRPQLAGGRRLRAVVVFGVSVLLSLRFGLSPIPVLGLAALVGFFWRVPATK
ncbi:MAG TPA: chromate transporter [Bryobacteraceae bacterium]|nr:chromate transporter [Bryobacteraceae bacterium]